MLEQILATLSPNIIKSLGTQASLGTHAVRARFLESFGDYINQSIERCRWVRTLMSQDRLLELESIYVEPMLTGVAPATTVASLLESLKSGAKLVITGTAGQGKTSLVKHLVTRLVDGLSKRVPLLINLRDVDYNPSDDDLHDPTSFYRYLYSICVSSSRARHDAMSLFLSGLEIGSFILIFDGFDEVPPDRRSRLVREFQLIGVRLPRCGCLITSRPNTGVQLLEGFSSLTLAGMTGKQIEALIKRAPTDDSGLKDRFLAEIRESLLITHASFLGVPLTGNHHVNNI
jgi:hypothetical protein